MNHDDLITADEAWAIEARSMSEREFQAKVVEHAEANGFLVYHTWNSRNSASGFPDLCMVRPPRLIFAELKRENGKVSDAQQEWIDALRGTYVEDSCGKEGCKKCSDCGIPQVYLWRPSDWDSIIETLDH